MKRKILVSIVPLVMISALLCGTALASSASFLGHTVTYSLSYSDSATASTQYSGTPCYTYASAQYNYIYLGVAGSKYADRENYNGGPTIATTAAVPYGCVHVSINASHSVQHDLQGWSSNYTVPLS